MFSTLDYGRYYQEYRKNHDVGMKKAGAAIIHEYFRPELQSIHCQQGHIERDTLVCWYCHITCYSLSGKPPRNMYWKPLRLITLFNSTPRSIHSAYNQKWTKVHKHLTVLITKIKILKLFTTLNISSFQTPSINPQILPMWTKVAPACLLSYCTVMSHLLIHLPY